MPNDATSISFGPYRLHPTQGLSHGDREIRVTPKALSVLYVLASRSRQVVTKAELFDTVWAKTVVTDAALSSCIRELRQALGDDARNPHFIETIHRRGFRLLETCTIVPLKQPDHGPGQLHLGDGLFVGRESEITELASLQDQVGDSLSYVAFVEGEEGIGKTSLVHRFAAGVAQLPNWQTCSSQCLEELSAGLAYQPLLEAIRQLCLQPGGAHVVSILRRVAPTWLAETSSVLDPAEHRALRHKTSCVTASRFRKELEDALAALSAVKPLLLVLEDLQWSDSCTLEWIDSIARQPIGASVLIVATHSEAPACSKHHGSTALKLGPLERTAIVKYLERRYPGLDREEDCFTHLADAVHRASGGNPSFLLLILDELVLQRVLVDRHGVWTVAQEDKISALEPLRDIRQLVERGRTQLGDCKRRVLEAASVAGTQFSSAEAAAGAEISPEEVEDTLQGLVHTGEITRVDVTVAPTDDTTTTEMFQFGNRRLRRALLDSLLPSERRRMHHRIGRSLEAAYGASVSDRALRLASHFERAYDVDRAIAYLREASAVNRRRGAHAIAHTHLCRAQAWLERLPESSERVALDALLNIAVASELIPTQGFSTAEIDEYYERAFGLQQNMIASPQQFEILWRLWVYFFNRGPLHKAREIADRLSIVAEQLDSPALLLDVYHAKWGTALLLGKLGDVKLRTRQGISLCGAGANGMLAMTRGCTLHDAHLSDHHAAVCAGFFSAWADGLTGRQESAKRTLDATVAHARDIDHPYSLAVALVMSAAALAASGDAIGTMQFAAEGAALASQHGFDVLHAWAYVYEGWATAQLGDSGRGIRTMCEGLAAYRNTALWLFRPFQLSLAAQVEFSNGMLDRAADSLEEAFTIAETVGERLAAAELHRLRGELNLATSANSSQAEGDLRKALEIATAQEADLVRSRVLRSLAKLQRTSTRYTRRC